MSSSIDPLRLDGAHTMAPVPWWRVGVMWLFVGGLGLVVIGSFALLATAVKHADTVESQVVQRAAQRTAPAALNTSTAPALQARNHAATPVP
jgi:uncharacterized protein